jgi:hypothetical protein
MKNLYIISILFIFLESCAVINLPLDENRMPINENVLSKLKGTYYNYPLDSAFGKYQTLWSQFGNDNFETISYKEFVLKIDFVNKKKAKIKLIRQGKVVKTRTVHGKIINDCFYLRRKFMIVPFFPIVFGYYNKKARMSILEDCLIIDTAWNISGFAIIAGTNDKGQGSYRYNKIKVQD